MTFNCPFTSGSSMCQTRLSELAPSTAAASSDLVGDGLQTGVEDQHEERTDPGETHEDQRARVAVCGLASHAVPKLPEANVARG